MNYNLQGKTWEGASDLPEVETGVSATPHSQEGHPERAGLHVCRPFPVGFFKNADSHVAPAPYSRTAVGRAVPPRPVHLNGAAFKIEVSYQIGFASLQMSDQHALLQRWTDRRCLG